MTLAFFKVTGPGWKSALVGENLGHVIVLHVAQCLLIVLGASADQIVKIVSDLEDLSVHHHQLNQSHVLAFVILPVLTIEDLSESNHDHLDLEIVQSVLRKLVFAFEVLRVLQQHIW